MQFLDPATAPIPQAESDSTDITTNMLVLVASTYIVISLVILFAFGQDVLPDSHRYPELGVLISRFLAGGEVQYFTYRIVWIFASLLIVVLLNLLGLVERRTMLLALIWPIWILMTGRPHPEFFVFFLYLIRLDRSMSFDLGVLAFLALCLFVTGENNLLLLMNFRGLVWLSKFQSSKLFWAAVITQMGVALLANTGFGEFLSFLPGNIDTYFERFDYIRNIVNPEFSVFESIAVFISSCHFFTVHYAYWQIDAAVTVAIFWYLAGSRTIQRMQPFHVIAFLCTWSAAVLITHGFQNARYYLFFLPVLAAALKPRQFAPIAFFGLVHVFFKLADVVSSHA